MKRWHFAALIAGLFVAVCTLASDRSANSYQTRKLSTNAVLVTCNDEREPVAKKLENGPFLIVTCQPPTSK